jgi:hypothetical protein
MWQGKNVLDIALANRTAKLQKSANNGSTLYCNLIDVCAAFGARA